MKFNWLNKDSRLFLKRGYLEEGQNAEGRIREIAEAAQKILKNLNGKINEKNKDAMVMSAWGPSSDIEVAIKAIGKVNLLEIARSGSIGLHEGTKVLKI